MIFLMALPVCAQSSKKELDQIRNRFEEVNAYISQYKKVVYPDVTVDEDTSAGQYAMEGAEIYRLATVKMTKYFDDEQLVKVEVVFDGDREDMVSEYYLKEGNLCFVDKVKTVYHKPKWDDAFNASEKSVAKNHFYIKDHQLIRWIDPKINSVGKAHPSFRNHEAIILHDYALYISY